jgi:exodeoxyribonuclease-5
MHLSPQQQQAVEAVRSWLADPNRKPVFRLFGYAGTGKTTIAKELTKDVHALYATFTGKAALILQEKGCSPASTIHSLIYLPKVQSGEALKRLRDELKSVEAQDPVDMDRVADIQKWIRLERERVETPNWSLKHDSVLKGADLLVLDECSMIDGQIASDLMQFGVPILALGDPAQLPPVKGFGYFIQDEPDFMLTEIHRQKEGSPVLDLATMARSRGYVEVGDYGDSEVRQAGNTQPAELASYDQVLCGRNRTRKKANRAIRRHLGRTSPLPEPGDKLVCLRNDKENGLLNGSQWICHSVQEIDEDTMFLELTEYGREDDQPFGVYVWKHPFEDREDDLNFWEIKDAQLMDFGYCLTVHKAQGSGWPSVAVIDESDVFRSSSREWIYTAITRASERILIIS